MEGSRPGHGGSTAEAVACWEAVHGCAFGELVRGAPSRVIRKRAAGEKGFVSHDCTVATHEVLHADMLSQQVIIDVAAIKGAGLPGSHPLVWSFASCETDSLVRMHVWGSGEQLHYQLHAETLDGI